MKRFLYTATLLLSLSLMASCEKENSENYDSNSIEGRWYNPVKWEDLFNGKVMNSSTDFSLALFSYTRIKFENNYLITIKNGSRGSESYYYADGTCYIGGRIFNVIKADSKELIADYPYSSGYDINSVKKESVITNFQGKDIYCSYIPLDYLQDSRYNFDFFWYYDKKGNRVDCSYYIKDGFDEGIVTETVYNTKFDAYEQKIVKFNIEYWYDTERFYLKAEEP